MIGQLAAVEQVDPRGRFALDGGKIVQSEAVERGREQRNTANRTGYRAVIGEDPVLRIVAVDAIACRRIDHRARGRIEGGRAWAQGLQRNGGG
jgi:hypothetical protein